MNLSLVACGLNIRTNDEQDNFKFYLVHHKKIKKDIDNNSITVV